VSKKPSPYLTDEENPPLTAAMLRRARPTREVFAELGIRYPGQRGPQKTPTKVQVTVRLDRDVVEQLRAARPGWQTRANEILRRSVLRAGGQPRTALGARESARLRKHAATR
jgi:uncharacterized protein (DUF4415 family)